MSQTRYRTSQQVVNRKRDGRRSGQVKFQGGFRVEGVGVGGKAKVFRGVGGNAFQRVQCHDPEIIQRRLHQGSGTCIRGHETQSGVGGQRNVFLRKQAHPGPGVGGERHRFHVYPVVFAVGADIHPPGVVQGCFVHPPAPETDDGRGKRRQVQGRGEKRGPAAVHIVGAGGFSRFAVARNPTVGAAQGVVVLGLDDHAAGPGSHGIGAGPEAALGIVPGSPRLPVSRFFQGILQHQQGITHQEEIGMFGAAFRKRLATSQAVQGGDVVTHQAAVFLGRNGGRINIGRCGQGKGKSLPVLRAAPVQQQGVQHQPHG